MLWALVRVDHRPAVALGCNPLHLGPSFDCRAHLNPAELGHGVQAVGPRLQSGHVLRLRQGTKGETDGVLHVTIACCLLVFRRG